MIQSGVAGKFFAQLIGLAKFGQRNFTDENIPVDNPTALTVSPDGKHLYIAGQGTTTAYIATVDIDESSPTAYSIIATRDLPLPGYHVSDLAVSGDGTRVYATAFTITDSVATGPTSSGCASL